MLRKILRPVLPALLCTASLFAVSTSFYDDASIGDFEKGKLEGVLINEKGELAIAPTGKPVLTTDDLFVWALAPDGKGGVFAASGVRGRIQCIAADGKVSPFAEVEANTIRALARSPQGLLYAAASPQGRIYAFDENGRATEVAKFAETYLWDIKFGQDGRLRVATGNPARLYSLDVTTGKSELVFEAPAESHFLCMAIAPGNTVYLGSEGNGILYRIGADGKAKALYDSHEDEIAALLVDGRGRVWFGTASQRRRQLANNFNYDDTFTFREPEQRAHERAQQQVPRRQRAQPLKNSLYRLSADDKVEKIFTLSETSFLSLAADSAGNIYAGSGEYGVLYRIDPAGVSARLLRSGEAQILALLDTGNRLYLGTGNNGKVFALDYRETQRGTYLSRVFDCQSRVTWGSLVWRGSMPSGTQLVMETRSGDTDTPGDAWSQWTPTGPGDLIRSPSARYLQYRIRLESTRLGVSPLIQSVRVPFLRQNRAPRVSNIQFITYAEGKNDKKLNLQPGQCVITWQGVDDDGDSLKYRVFFRMADDERWRLLKDDLTQNRISFAMDLLPDGEYFFRVEASDVLSNPEETALTGRQESRLALIDTTPPQFVDLKAEVGAAEVVITGTVRDSHSPITSLRYSVNAVNWRAVHPLDKVFDSREERFRIVLSRKNHPHLLSGRNLVLLRAADAADQTVAASVSFEITLGAEDTGRFWMRNPSLVPEE